MENENVINYIYSKVEELKNEIIRRHKAAGQYTTGKTASSFRVEKYDKGVRLYGAKYAGVLERGRKPGKVPFNFMDILIKWADAKGISFRNQTDARSWAWCVSRKIRNEGTKMYAEGRTEDIFTTPVEELKSKLKKGIPSVFKTEIINKIFKP